MFEKLCYTQCRHCRCRTQLLFDFLKSMKRITDFITDLGQCRGLQESNAYILYLKSHISIPLILLFTVIWFPLQLSPVLMLANIKKKKTHSFISFDKTMGYLNLWYPPPKLAAFFRLEEERKRKNRGDFEVLCFPLFLSFRPLWVEGSHTDVYTYFPLIWNMSLLTHLRGRYCYSHLGFWNTFSFILQSPNLNYSL